MQFRSIERRLLSRFRDKTPSSSALANLDTLLEGTHRQIAAAAEALEECDAELASSSCNLSCITQLLLLLARLSTGMSAEEVDRLRAALSPVVQVGQEQGWEETTDAALTFLLRTSLAKPGKENQGATPISLDAPKDTVRLKKHISSVMDRVSKGGRISDTRNAMGATSLLDFRSMAEGEEDEGVDAVGATAATAATATTTSEQQLPPGSRFGEAGERLRSARARSARPYSAAAASNKAAANNNQVTNGQEKEAPGKEDYADVENHIRNEEDEDGGIEGDIDESADADELLGW